MLKAYLLIYNILFILFLPLIIFVFIFNNKYKEDLFYKFLERLAFYRRPLNSNSKMVIWLHCASVGEIRAVEPILDELKNKYYIVLTANTKNAIEYAQNLRKADFIALFPIDIYPIMCKAFNNIKPDILILVETEFWATMLYTASQRNVKVITINGRISEKSFKYYKKIKFFWKYFIGLISLVIAISKDDADRFEFFIGSKKNIVISNNIKYDRNFTLSSKRKDFLLSKDDFIFTAGSTRKGEEEIIADVYNKINLGVEKVKFFLAPRHLSRIGDITKILESKFIKYSLFSSGNFNSNFILVDLFGRLQSIYSISNVCYVGGSLVNKGGQNPIEPAAYGNFVLFGKNMDNFKTEAENLIKNGAAFIVEDVNDLTDEIKKFISNRQLLEDAGRCALKAVKSQKGALTFTIKKIKESLDV